MTDRPTTDAPAEPVAAPTPAPGDPCGTGICGADIPPLVGSTLTGTGLTLDQAARVLIEDGAPPPLLSPIQRRLVEEHAARLDDH